MKKQNTIPPVLRGKAVLTVITGAGVGMVAIIAFAVSKDRTMLTLGGILFLWCLLRGGMLWQGVSAGHYECITGICTSVSRQPFRRYKKVHLTLEDGNETALLLGMQERIRPDTWYRFYFRNSSAPRLGNDYLDAALSINVFLGFEEITMEKLPQDEEK
ncbi:MAG: hypothetical protein NC091_03205 [Bacteroides sp.]|nr:hypothetical protein [Bacteroides sp.]